MEIKITKKQLSSRIIDLETVLGISQENVMSPNRLTTYYYNLKKYTDKRIGQATHWLTLNWRPSYTVRFPLVPDFVNAINETYSDIEKEKTREFGCDNREEMATQKEITLIIKKITDVLEEKNEALYDKTSDIEFVRRKAKLFNRRRARGEKVDVLTNGRLGS